MSDRFQFDIPFRSRVVPKILEDDAEIRFRCYQGVSCFNACCRKADVMLTPYDLVRLKGNLGIGGSELLRRYTLPFELDADKVPGVKLRTDDDGACLFLTEEGCSVYPDRPTACRYYPVAHLALRPKDSPTERHHYALIKEDLCKGHEEGRRLSIRDYRKEQGLEIYDEMNREWFQLILKKKSAGPAVGKPPELSLHLYFMACFDHERFRRFVMSDSFKQSYTLPKSSYEELANDDVALIKFGFRFLRQVLFGERSLQEREDVWNERYQRRKELFELRKQAEIARAQKKEDDKHEDGV